MIKLILRNVRLTWLFFGFFGLFLLLAANLPAQELDSAALTLFSVNSFLYGFYIAPILGAQKSRIEEMHKVVRAEANALFGILLKTKQLPGGIRSDIQKSFSTYIDATVSDKGITAGEKQYERIVTYLVEYKGDSKDQVDEILDAVVANQQNRTMLHMHRRNKVYSNEWMIMAVLFSITLGFILMLDIGSSALLLTIKALLCTGLTMLIVILAKLSTLTHKKAREIWEPLKNFKKSHFYSID